MSGVMRGQILRLAPTLRTNVTQKATYVYGPPRQRVPWMEKLGLGTVMMVGVTFPSLYLMGNIQNYKKKEE